jgi:ABC-type Mn2+/Zn2+ transport system ATPase subunit
VRQLKDQAIDLHHHHHHLSLSSHDLDRQTRQGPQVFSLLSRIFCFENPSTQMETNELEGEEEDKIHDLLETSRSGF